MKTIKQITLVFIALFLTNCKELGDVLSALSVPNNTISHKGKSFKISEAEYGGNNGYCGGQAFFISAYTTSNEVIKVILAEYPNSNTSYSVYTPDRNGSCYPLTAFVRIHLPNGNVEFSSGGGTCTLNDNAGTFALNNVKLSDGSTINGKGSFTN